MLKEGEVDGRSDISLQPQAICSYMDSCVCSDLCTSRAAFRPCHMRLIYESILCIIVDNHLWLPFKGCTGTVESFILVEANILHCFKWNLLNKLSHPIWDCFVVMTGLIHDYQNMLLVAWLVVWIGSFSTLSVLISDFGVRSGSRSKPLLKKHSVKMNSNWWCSLYVDPPVLSSVQEAMKLGFAV